MQEALIYRALNESAQIASGLADATGGKKQHRGGSTRCNAGRRFHRAIARDHGARQIRTI